MSFERNDGWAYSSHISLSLLFAIFPFCIFSLALAGQISAQLNTNDVVEFVFGNWPDQISEPLRREAVAVLSSSNSRNLTLGALFAVFFASNGVDAVRRSMANAYA
ncbi:MAG: YhjD/YihY/BrkB family envelope integrity protein, partial [Rhizobiaceae bacterium]